MDRINATKQTARAIPFGKGIRKSGRKSPIGQFLNSHARRLTVEMLHLLFNSDWIYWLIGLANERFGLIESVFLVYPANEEYMSAYAYRYRAKRHEWKPGPIGFFWQNGKIGVKFAISAHNGQFRDPSNKENLRRVVDRMEKLRTLFHAKRKTFAGILPGILLAMRIIRETHEVEVTVKVVVKATEQVKSLEDMATDAPIIVLGGRGFIGRRVVAALPKSNGYCVDVASGKPKNDWPVHLKGERAILVNISLNSALDEYLHLLWPEVVVINEVYPEPSQETVDKLKSIGCSCYHICGVEGGALPSFPHGYEGGIPCCAAWPSDGIEALLFKVV